MVVDTISPDWTHEAANSLRGGYRIQAKGNYTITAINKHANCTATRCLIYTDAGVLITSAAFSGDVATFSQSITNGTFYKIEADNSGSDYTMKYRVGDTSTFYPVSGTNIDYIAAVDNESVVADRAFNIVSVTSISPDVTLTPSALTLTTTLATAEDVVIHVASALTMTGELESVMVTARIPLPDPFVGTGGLGTKYIRTKWPFEYGLTAGTTLHKRHSAEDPI